MIKALLDLVCSYLDPDTYKTLIQINPNQFTQLLKIKRNYEDAIPEIMRTNIIRNGITLKYSMMILFSEIENLKHNLDFTNIKPIYNKIKYLIEDWYIFRIENLIDEYKKVDQDLFKYFIVNINGSIIQLSFKTYHTYQIFTYSGGIYHSQQSDDIKESMATGEMMINIKKILNHKLSTEKQISDIRQYLETVNLEKLQEIKYAILLILDKQPDKINELLEFLNRSDLQIFEDPNTIKEINDEIIDGKNYRNRKLFQFSDIVNKKLFDISDNREYLQDSCILCIYNIIETVDQFLRIFDTYYKLYSHS